MRTSLQSAVASLTLAAAVVAASASPAAAKKFGNDGNHTMINFRASTTLFDVDGRFDKYNLSIEGDPEALGPVKVRVEIDTRSIATNNKTRDEHLRSPDFLDAKKYPKIVFVADKAVREGDKVVLDGTIELHGVKKAVRIPFTKVVAKNGAGVEEHVYKGDLALSRKDFGIGLESVAARISLADEVTVKLLIAGFFE